MATASQFEIKCGTCGYWMPVPLAGDAPDGASHVGSVVKCRKCLQRTTCTGSNLRLKPEGGDSPNGGVAPARGYGWLPGR